MDITLQKKWQRNNRLLSWCALAPCLLLFYGCATVNDEPSPGNAGSRDEISPPPNFTRGLIPLRTAQPLYPLRARNLGVEGWVMLSFTVNEDGTVIGNSIETIQEEPSGYFELSATNAARRMTFENTRSQPIEDIRYVFRYELEEDNPILVDPPSEEIEYRDLISKRYITPDYPEVALELRIEGFAVVSFTVTENGTVEDLQIEEAEPLGVFNESALRAASRLSFEPRIVFNEPVRVENVRYRFVWELSD